MKAIAHSISPLAGAAAAMLLLLGSCSAAPPVAPIRAPEPAPLAPPPIAAPPARGDWRDIMPPPGTWRWSLSDGRSSAHYLGTDGTALASLSCDHASGQVLLGRAGSTGPAAGQIAMGVATTGAGQRPLLSSPQAGPTGWVVAAIAARDPLLDAMAFSRGRFLLEVAGLPSLALPSWPEVSRVIEDCR